MGLIRPSFLDNMSWEMAEVYGAVTDQILINLASYFPYWKSGNVPKSAFEYQANMLAQMGQVNADTIKIIKNGLKGANKTLAGCLEQAIIEAVKKAQPELLKGVKSGILKPAGIPIVAPTQMRAFQLYYQQAAQKLNLVNTVMLESTKQAYQATVSDITNRVQATQTALDIGAGETVTGVSSWNQAVRHSIDRMKRDGITGFIDHGGHRWSAEAYTSMDIRTTVANTARSAVWETNQDFGNDLYLVSYHNGARPLCYPWQNKVISSTDNARIVTDLDGNEIPVWRQSDTSYGEPAGLFGINCKHYPSPFIPGVSLIRGEPQSPEENERTYEESQKQRALERKIREEKRDLLMMKAQGASEEEIKAQRAKIRQTDDDIDAFCDATGRARRQNREGVYTQRSFPDPDSYDPTTFEREQKETIEKYFSGGGSQTGYTFGQMDTGAQVVTTSGTVQAETPPVAPVAQVTPAADHPTTGTLQMYDEALQWSIEGQQAEMENLREGWKNVETQIKAFDEFEKEVPAYERTIKEAIEREEFATRTYSGDVVHILEDGRFKSQIETGASHGYLDVERRKQVTNSLFAGSEQLTLSSEDYEIYGYLGNAPRADMYGNVRIVLKKENLINRTTITVGDSLELVETGADPMATLAKDPKFVSYGKVFSESVPNAPDRLKDVQLDIDSIAKNGYLSGGNYIELQFHGGVTTDDIEYVQMSTNDVNSDKIRELAEKAGVKIKWTR